MQLPPNHRYQIGKHLGTGANGYVYRTYDKVDKKEVAIKTPRDNTEDDYNTLYKELEIHREISPLTNLVPKLLDYFELDGKPYMVQELIHGASLYDTWYNSGSYLLVWMTLYHILRSIQEFHRLGYVHNDIHLGNIMWTGDGVKIIDLANVVNISQVTHIDQPLLHQLCDDITELLDNADTLIEDTQDMWILDQYSDKILRLYTYTLDNRCYKTDNIHSYTQRLMEEYQRLDAIENYQLGM